MRLRQSFKAVLAAPLKAQQVAIDTTVLPEHPLAFVHVPKTGGTTISDWLDEHYSQSSQLVPENPEDFRTRAKTETSDGKCFLSARLIRGHLNCTDGVRFAEYLSGQRRMFVTVLRKPEAQTMSMLWHWASQKLGLTSGRDHARYDPALHSKHLLEAATEIDKLPFASQFSLFCDPDEEDAFLRSDLSTGVLCDRISAFKQLHCVGLNERMQDSMRLFAWRLKWPPPRTIPRVRFSDAGSQRLPDEVRQLYGRRLALDEALYGRAEERFEADFLALCRAAGGQDSIVDFLIHQAESAMVQSGCR